MRARCVDGGDGVGSRAGLSREAELRPLVDWDPCEGVGHVCGTGAAVRAGGAEMYTPAHTHSTGGGLNDDDSDAPLLSDSRQGYDAAEYTSAVASVGTVDAADQNGTYVDAVLQAAVFVDDAIHNRSVRHRVDRRSLEIYRMYYSVGAQWAVFAGICTLLLLSFFEYPSSVLAPRAVTGTIEGVCVAILACDIGTRWRVLGRSAFTASRWNVCYVAVLVVTVVDFVVSLALPEGRYFVVRRLLRPFFLAQSSALLKKTLKNVLRCVPEILSVLSLLALHLFVFAALGCMLFHGTEEGAQYFDSLRRALVTMFVLLTTANHPDVMMPAYTESRWYALFFVIFLLVGLYCVMNVLTAIIYNQFRGYLVGSMQASYFRRKVAMRGAYEVLRLHARPISLARDDAPTVRAGDGGVPIAVVLRFVAALDASAACKAPLLESLHSCEQGAGRGAHAVTLGLVEFLALITPVVQRRQASSPPLSNSTPWFVFGRRLPMLSSIRRIMLNPWYNRTVNVVIVAGAFLAAAEISRDGGESIHEWERAANVALSFLYFVETVVRAYALGPRSLVRGVWMFVDSGLVLAGFCASAATLARRGVSPESAWDLSRTECLLLLLRVVRLVPTTPRFHAMAVTIGHLLRSMSTFAGMLVIMYYEFALIGIGVFSGHVREDNAALNGTDFAKLNYWPNTFDTFSSSIVVLWDLMVVNNWYVIMEGHVAATSEWSRLFFISWYLVSVVVATNLLVALILEAFIQRWETLREDKAPSQAATHPATHLRAVSQQPGVGQTQFGAGPSWIQSQTSLTDVVAAAPLHPLPLTGLRSHSESPAALADANGVATPDSEVSAADVLVRGTALEDIFGANLKEPTEDEILEALGIGATDVVDSHSRLVSVAQNGDLGIDGALDVPSLDRHGSSLSLNM